MVEKIISISKRATYEKKPPPIVSNFNSRSCEKDDVLLGQIVAEVTQFQSTLLRKERPLDAKCITSLEIISIHALT